MEKRKLYHVAVYLRLSREDMDGSGAESNSIRSQRELIRSFVEKNSDMEIYDTYVDDGWSGTNFDRPAFLRMMKDLEDGHVNCVIVKDLSRLGRDYIEAGRLIQKTFPSLSVRFIAIADQYDSLTAGYHETSLVLPVKNFVNDSYCRDISNKVRTHQKLKREQGQFIGAFAVYGYQKSPKNKYQLVPDTYAAEIVKKIFAWKMEGYSAFAIAAHLDEWGVPSPMEYKKLQRKKHHTGFAATINAKWSPVAVKRILTNETYIGTLVQGKEEKVNYKVKKFIKKPEEAWIRVKHAHQAVISEEDFSLVQKLLQADIRAGIGMEKSHIYAGFLHCGDCMELMFRRVRRRRGLDVISYICATKNKGKGCSIHQIAEEQLGKIVLTVLQQQIALFLDREQAAVRIGDLEVDFSGMQVLQKGQEALWKKLEQYRLLNQALEEDFEKNIITQEEWESFGEIYQKQQSYTLQMLQRQEETQKKLFQSGLAAGIWLERMKETLQLAELDRMVIVTFVKRIFIYEDRRIVLELNYRSPSLFPDTMEGNSNAP